jgi:hypothetical protein
VISQLERLNSNETKIAPRSVWIAVNGSDLSVTTFMVSSKMGGGDPHFDAESIATRNHVMGSRKSQCRSRPAETTGKAEATGEASEIRNRGSYRGNAGSTHGTWTMRNKRTLSLWKGNSRIPRRIREDQLRVAESAAIDDVSTNAD